MARFLAEVQGNKGSVHRLGSGTSGIRAQAQGWNAGVTVLGHDGGGTDEFDVYATGGSGGGDSPILIGTVYRSPSGVLHFRRPGKPAVALR